MTRRDSGRCGRARLRVAALCREERGQAVVELAVVAPVLLALALIAYNVMTFAAAVARFDRVAPDVVLAQAVSPAHAGEGVDAVRAELERAMEGYDVELEVAVAEGAASGGEELLSLAVSLETYTCTLRYAPAPSSFSIAGVHVEVPAFLVHEREVVVDPWRSGVVV